MDPQPKAKLILIRETAAESWTRDASTFVLVVAIIGVGVLLGSSAMQWVGALMAFIVITARATSFRKQHTFTVAEARKRLDEIEGKREMPDRKTFPVPEGCRAVRDADGRATGEVERAA